MTDSSSSPSPGEWRILIFAPTGNDAGLTAGFLRAAGLTPEIMPDLATLNVQAREGCGAILIAEEALSSRAATDLFTALKQQEAWSDIPVALITSGGVASEQRLQRLRSFGAEGNVTLLERPFRPGTLVSALEVALRARRRQYEVRRLLAELGTARDAAERASRAKDEFLAALSHELRTPLNPVLLLATEAADNPALPAPIRADFQQIARSIGLEARLIDDLLDLTRITRGKLSLDLQPIDVHQVLREAIATTQAEINEKNLILEIKLGAAHSRIAGDAVRLQQVFWNVLKNAAKFTPLGGTIRVETWNDGITNDLVTRITDSGVGMTTEEIERVFEAFAQGDHAGTQSGHRFGGLGLGLAISRMLVGLHGGGISASSAGRGQGAAFTVQLGPVETGTARHPPTPLPGSQPDTMATAVPRGRRVLMVEDHGPTRITLEKLLLRRGYEVKTASTLAEARVLARQGRFDLLLSDLGLPDGSGCDLMMELRDQLAFKGIALSGYGMDMDIAQSRRAGFGVHLVKPVSVQVLEAALAQIEQDGK